MNFKQKKDILIIWAPFIISLLVSGLAFKNFLKSENIITNFSKEKLIKIIEPAEIKKKKILKNLDNITIIFEKQQKKRKLISLNKITINITAIIISDKNKACIINGNRFFEGQYFNNMKIVKIDEDRVYFKKQNKIIILRLGEHEIL